MENSSVPYAIAILLSAANPALAAEDIFQLYGNEADTIELATGTAQALATAPAVATVITSEDIERLGATTVAQVLETVPGLHLSTERAVGDIFVVRGFFHPFNVHLLVLINGIPVNDIANGGRPQAWSMPVHNIAKIEVLRGPGSALYGADAFSGVINIITKTAKDIPTGEMGVYGGSHDTAGVWALHGMTESDIQASLALEARTTNGYAETVRADQQSRIDALLGTTASLAPGPLNTARDDFEARIDVARPTQWRFRAGYQGFHDVGTGAGIGLALDPDGRLNVDLFNADFTYRPPLPKPWEGDIQASYLRTVTEGDVTTLPSGTLRGLFPVGIRNAFTYDVNQFRLDATVRHEGFFGHQISFGAGVHRSENATEEKVNYLVTPAGILPAGRFADTRDLGIDKALPDSERTNIYAFVQDQWHLAPDWHLTAGLRVDRYSDFGTAVNPRLALVWNAAPDLIFKALYGRAFRAPSFFDLYGNSPFILVGDRRIKPEKLDMLELVVFKSWVPYPLSTTLNIFGYETRDLIAIEPTDPLAFASPSNNRNIDGTRGHGLEFELRYDPVPDIRLKLNYSFQHQDEGTSLMGKIAPEQQFYGEINWRFLPHWQLNTRAKWIVDPSSYAFVDLTLRNTEAVGIDRWDVILGVNNLFGTDAHEATLFTRALPEGVPLPGRNVTAQIRYRF